MAFSFRHIISNIPYFKKSDEENSNCEYSGEHIDPTENNLGEAHCCSKNEFKSKVKSNKKKQTQSKNVSLSDTDLLNSITKSNKSRKRSKKLKLDIEKANKSASDILNITEEAKYDDCAVENTPKQVTLFARTSDIFSERLKGFDLDKSYDVFELMNDEQIANQNYDIQSLSDQTDSDVSIISETKEVKMCRKVQAVNKCFNLEDNAGKLSHSSSAESFVEIDIDKNEEERISLLLSYQMKFEKMERLLQKLLTEFQFHIEMSKVFHTKSTVTTLPGTHVTKLPKKVLGDITYIDNISRSESPLGGWNIVIENEDKLTKFKLRKQLLSMKHFLESFINVYLQDNREVISKPTIQDATSFITPIQTQSQVKKLNIKRLKINKKKSERRINDFPDYKESLQNLFSLHKENDESNTNIMEILNDFNDSILEKCTCKCKYHNRDTSPSQTDSGLMKEDNSNQSISSSIGNFTLDSLALSAYSESLDNIISYQSFNDSTLYSTLLQKAAIERITFYVQVHSIQLKSEMNELDFETKSTVTFNCHSCLTYEENEQDLLKHILSSEHCEKIHFLYKTAYIKKCLASGKEIQPSTVLNPMKMYRDDNKIVCFGDGVFACTLCFENMIIGESVLMTHCNEPVHVERRDQLNEFMEFY